MYLDINLRFPELLEIFHLTGPRWLTTLTCASSIKDTSGPQLLAIFVPRLDQTVTRQVCVSIIATDGGRPTRVHLRLLLRARTPALDASAPPAVSRATGISVRSQQPHRSVANKKLAECAPPAGDGRSVPRVSLTVTEALTTPGSGYDATPAAAPTSWDSSARTGGSRRCSRCHRRECRCRGRGVARRGGYRRARSEQLAATAAGAAAANAGQSRLQAAAAAAGDEV